MDNTVSNGKFMRQTLVVTVANRRLGSVLNVPKGKTKRSEGLERVDACVL